MRLHAREADDTLDLFDVRLFMAREPLRIEQHGPLNRERVAGHVMASFHTVRETPLTFTLPRLVRQHRAPVRETGHYRPNTLVTSASTSNALIAPPATSARPRRTGRAAAAPSTRASTDTT